MYSSDSILRHHLRAGLRRIKISLLRSKISTEIAINDSVFGRREVQYLLQPVVGVRIGNMPFALRFYPLVLSRDLS